MSRANLDFNAIRSVTHGLKPAEADLSDAIASNAELIASVARAQRSMNISPGVTQGLISQLNGANTDLVNGMGKTVEAHRLLASIRDDLGIRVVAYGGGMWKGTKLSSDASSPNGSLQIVLTETDPAAA